VADVLVALSGDEHGWSALEQAILIAQLEGGRLNGLHAVRSEADLESAAAQAVEDEFLRRCAAAGISGQLAIAVGTPADLISERARWNDLVVVSVAHPPGSGAFARLRSGFHALVQHCPRPILAVPQSVVPVRSALLSYDGSPKATEALYVAAYLTLQWSLSLVVVTVHERSQTTDEILAQAQQYLEANGITATYVTAQGQIANAILETAAEYESDVILVGGYGYQPLIEAVLGSTVDQLLRDSDRPLLICR
jgi:nucleotide-binding universal stress UspA family protein